GGPAYPSLLPFATPQFERLIISLPLPWGQKGHFSRGQLQSYCPDFRLLVVNELALHDRPVVDLETLVVDVAADARARLKLQRLDCVDGAIDCPVYDDVCGLHFAVDARALGEHDRARLVRQGADVSAHRAVDSQATAEKHVALDARGRPDQGVDMALRLVLLAEHGTSLNSVARFPLLESAWT